MKDIMMTYRKFLALFVVSFILFTNTGCFYISARASDIGWRRYTYDSNETEEVNVVIAYENVYGKGTKNHDIIEWPYTLEPRCEKVERTEKAIILPMSKEITDIEQHEGYDWSDIQNYQERGTVDILMGNKICKFNYLFEINTKKGKVVYSHISLNKDVREWYSFTGALLFPITFPCDIINDFFILPFRISSIVVLSPGW